MVVEIKIKAGGGETDINQKLHHDTLGGRRTESDARGMLEFGILRDAEIKRRRSSILPPPLLYQIGLYQRRFGDASGGEEEEEGGPRGREMPLLQSSFFFLCSVQLE